MQSQKNVKIVYLSELSRPSRSLTHFAKSQQTSAAATYRHQGNIDSQLSLGKGINQTIQPDQQPCELLKSALAYNQTIRLKKFFANSDENQEMSQIQFISQSKPISKFIRQQKKIITANNLKGSLKHTLITQKSFQSNLKLESLERNSPNWHYVLNHYKVILKPNYIDLREEILKKISNQQYSATTQQKDIMKHWIKCLDEEDIRDLHFKNYSFPVKYYMTKKQIKQDIVALYGKGKNRILRPVEEATIINEIEKFLQSIESNISNLFKISNIGVQGMVQFIIQKGDLPHLQHYHICLKQIEWIWRIMITWFRCSGNEKLKQRNYQRLFRICEQRGHFPDLKINDSIRQFLLRNGEVEVDDDNDSSQITDLDSFGSPAIKAQNLAQI